MATSVMPGNIAAGRRNWGGTPEIYFSKTIDNSRLVKVEDPQRRREMVMFTASLAMLFLLVMVYAWQHFSAVEYGYKIEALKSQRDQIMEVNRGLRLEDARLRDPERIDMLARHMGLQSPQAGQVQHLDAASEPAAAEMARVSDVSVISALQ